MIIENAINEFLATLTSEGRSPHTIAAYRRDLDVFASFANDTVIEGLAVTSRSGLDPSDWFAVASAPILTAMGPTPADGVLYPDTWANLSWLPGETAASHDIYASDNFDNVNDRAAEAFQGNQPAAFIGSSG